MADGGQAKYRPYPVYKPSGVEWLGDIPEGWEVAALKHSVSVPITDGPHETPHFIDEGIPFVSAEAVSSGHIDFNKIRSHISQKDHDRYSQKYLPAFGDIYLVKSGATTGITAIVETDEVFNIWSPLAAIRCNDDMVPKFVLHFLRSAQFQEAIRLYWSFGTQQNIGMKVIENLQTSVPCKQEQTNIAAFLDHETGKIDGLIAKQQRLIALLEEKRQAVISHAVTKGLDPTAPLRPSGIDWLGDVPAHWEVSIVKYAFENLDKVRIPLSSEERSDMEKTYPYYGASGVIDLVDDYLFDEPLVLVSEDGANLLARSTPIAFSATGQYWVNNHAHILRPFDQNVEFWSEAIERNDLTPFVTGSAQPKFTSEALSNLPVAYPKNLDERNLLNEYLFKQKRKYGNMLAKAQAAITLLKERRTALISAAVTGKIDLRDWQAPEGAFDISTQDHSIKDITQNEEALA